MFHPIDDCEHPLLCLPGIGTALQEMAISGSLQQNIAGVCHSVVSLAAYVAEDGLVSHHWEERPLGLAKFIWPCTGELQGQEVGVGG